MIFAENASASLVPKELGMLLSDLLIPNRRYSLFLQRDLVGLEIVLVSLRSGRTQGGELFSCEALRLFRCSRTAVRRFETWPRRHFGCGSGALSLEERSHKEIH